MKSTIFIFLLIAAFASNVHAMDLRKQGPKGKSWVKITDIHYMDKSSVKKVKGKIYQATLCNRGGPRYEFWSYFKVRVDCTTKQAWSFSANEWIGPMSPSNFDEGVMKIVCK